MKAQIINTYGDVKSVKPKNNNTFTLKELQSYVDGYIQIVKKAEIIIYLTMKLLQVYTYMVHTT